jgi:CitMHS family citrate-Mg2+:H+ or citrate-Ca2+:H+ symporter
MGARILILAFILEGTALRRAQMLATWGLITILGMIAAISSRRVSPLVALFLFPVVASAAAGFGSQTAKFALGGIVSIAPVIAMFLFAILFFGVLTDIGMIAPLVRGLLRRIGKDPVLIVPGTAVLALLLHLDGSGAVVFLVAVPSLLPLYQEVGMDRRVLACAVSLAAGVNFLPWTGPTLRAASALHTTPLALFRPLIPIQIVGLVYVFAVAIYLGRREKRRIGIGGSSRGSFTELPADDQPISKMRFMGNALLALAVLGLVISGKLEPAIAFMLGTAVALLFNFQTVREQAAALDRHAKAAVSMCAILCSAGVFMGILRGTGMLASMAQAAIAHIPAGFAPHIPFVLALLSMPLSLLFDPDSFYFGVLPVLAAAVQAFGLPAASVAEAALLGQMTTGFPISPLTPATFLVTGLSDIDLSTHQRFAGPYLFGATLVMTLAAVLLHVIPL